MKRRGVGLTLSFSHRRPASYGPVHAILAALRLVTLSLIVSGGKTAVNKPSQKEEEYFLHLEVERIQKLRREHQASLAEQEKKRRKELHFLCCPKCGMDMTTSSIAGVEIEVCPDCHGVYLDAGELDKILDEKRRNVVLDTLARVKKLFVT
jgi:ribosomal protein L31